MRPAIAPRRTARSGASRADGTGSWGPLVAHKPTKAGALRSAAIAVGQRGRNRSGLLRQGAMPDVATMEGAIEIDMPGGAVGAIACLRQVVAQRAHAQHATTSRERTAVAIEFRAGVEDFHVGAEVGIQPRDRVTGFRFAGITPRRDHDAERWPGVPFRLGAI